MADEETSVDGELSLAPPKETLADRVHTVMRGAMSALPIIGGPAAELYNTVIAPPLLERQREWMGDVADAIHDLEGRLRLVVDDLKNNDAFLDTMLQATQAAIRTSNNEKREALKNAILNSALPSPPEETKRVIFVNLIDQFTVWHLRFLALFSNPAGWFATAGKTPPRWTIAGSLSQLLVAAFPELKDQRDLYELIGKDLYDRGLLNTSGFHTVLGGDGAMAKRTTPLGDEFIRFVRSPMESL